MRTVLPAKDEVECDYDDDEQEQRPENDARRGPYDVAEADGHDDQNNR